MDGILTKDKTLHFKDLSISFSNISSASNIVFSETETGIQFVSDVPVAQMGMMRKEQKMYMPGQPILVETKTLYSINHITLVVKTFLPKAKINLTQAVPGADASGIIREGKDAFVFKVSDGVLVKRINLFNEQNPMTQTAQC